MKFQFIMALLISVLMASTTSAQTKNPSNIDVIKLGVINDQSGPYADLAGTGSVWAAKKAVSDFKAKFPYLNIEVVSADHQNKPDIGANIVRRWYDLEKVDAVVDVSTTSVAVAVSQITQDKNKVFLGSAPASADLTGKYCSPNAIQWTYDTWAASNGTTKAVVKSGGDSWFFLTADYSFGHTLESEASKVVIENGGKVLGSVRHPFPGNDFSSFLITAQTSKAKVIGLANAGGDTINSIKQAAEFGIVKGGQNLATLLMFITDIHSIGLKDAQGLLLTEAWYWNMTDANRAFAKEFAQANNGRMPTMIQAGVYGAVTHYLKAVYALGDDGNGAKIVETMKQMKTDDPLFGKGYIREDGRKIHDMYLFEVKSPSESKGPWDYYKLRTTIPAEEAFRPLSQGGCPFVKK